MRVHLGVLGVGAVFSFSLQPSYVLSSGFSQVLRRPLETTCPYRMLQPQRGGCNTMFGLGLTTATFVYLPHSAVVIPCESARPFPTREKSGDESAPPQTGGACDLG